MKRSNFLKSIAAGAAFLGSPLAVFSKWENEDINERIASFKEKSDGSMVGFKVDPIKKVRIGMIGLGNRGKTLTEMFYWMIENEKAEIVALCDLKESNVTYVADKLKEKQKEIPAFYFKDENDWKSLAERDDIDLLVICTPWDLHTPMAVYGMEQGKHVASEVPIAYTLEDSWKLVNTAETTKRHCIMLENCCYNDEELFVLNMVENGVFGDLTHAEGAYLHDLRALLISDDYYQGQWRIKEHVERDANLYPTHGLGPISLDMHIGRGDTFSHLTSMSSRELNLSETAKREGSPYTNIKCGDMNNTLIRSKLGKTLLIQFDVHTGRPYSRINKLVGTKAVHDGYPSRLYIDDPKDLKYWGHEWLSDEAYAAYKEKYRHPMIIKLESIRQDYKQGHGGMDFVMMYRLIECLNQGLPLDLTVYDGVMWSAVSPLSEISVAKRSKSIDFPDFTGGTWKTTRELEIMRPISGS